MEFNAKKEEKKLNPKNMVINAKMLHRDRQTFTILDPSLSAYGRKSLEPLYLHRFSRKNHPINHISIDLKQSNMVCDRFKDHYQEKCFINL